MSVLRIPLTGRIIAEMLRALSENATPGPWEPFNGHVSALKDDVPAQYDVVTEDEHDEHADMLRYYGGEMVCESCSRADAALIAAVRNLLPALLDAYGNALEDVEHYQRRLRFAEAREAEARALVDLIRSQRYAPLQYPPAHVLGVHYTPQGRFL